MSKDDIGLLRTDPVLNQPKPNPGPRPRIRHELKTWPEEFRATYDGRMKFTLRRNDRDFQVGDQLLLREWDPEIESFTGEPGRYSGRTIRVRVDWIMGEKELRAIMDLLVMMPGYIIMSTSHVN